MKHPPSTSLLWFALLWLAACSPTPAPIHYGDFPIEKVALQPPMGWNSWDVFGADVTEAEVKAATDYMATHLKPHGYSYVVIDIAWYAPHASAIDKHYQEPRPHQLIDAYGRVIPDPGRFPSAQDGSFRALAEYVHSRGLKFGIHIMRGIPWQAVAQNTPILGTAYHARDIVTYEKACTFYDGMISIDMDRPGAQAYYNSLATLFAEWGVDFIKADDMTSYPPKFDEAMALRYALTQVSRPIVLSLSPGAVNAWDRHFLAHYADMYRVSGDFWDEWPKLQAQFQKAATFRHYTGPGHWADLDMIPLGVINIRGEHGEGARQSRFTLDEARTLMSLWTIYRSPLMLGMDLTQLDSATLALLTQPDALRIHRESILNRQVRLLPGAEAVWAAAAPDTSAYYAALFNLSDIPQDIELNLHDLGDQPLTHFKEIWTGETRQVSGSSLTYRVPPHGVCYLIASTAPYYLTPP